MGSHRTSVKLAQSLVFLAVMYFTVQLAISWGVEKKSWWQLSWEFVTGSSLGALVGLAFFVLVGAVGWVSGLAYGAVGLLGLAAGGALGGLGLGALVHIVRNPNSYNFHPLTIALTLTVGFFVAKAASSAVGRALVRREAAPVPSGA